MGDSFISELVCLVCGESYGPEAIAYVCPRHGAEGIVDVLYDYSRIAATFSQAALAGDGDRSMWRYRPLLPVADDVPVPPLLVGGTPLYAAGRLAKVLGVKQLWVKDDGRQPTSSLKDRASAIAVMRARSAGATVITTASTGNAGAALAGLCAATGQRAIIFVPESAPSAKIAQLRTYGATVLLVAGTYDDAFDLCLAAADKYGWYNRNTAFNPYMTEGKKSVSFEIAEQLDWQVPDVALVSVGDGCIIGGVHKGFAELVRLGWCDRMPRIVGVQAAGSNYLAEAWANGEDVLDKPAIKAQTVADSISAGLPRDRLKAMRAVRQSGGGFVTVDDDAILAAIPTLARHTGVFAEPAGAATVAGLATAVAQKLVDPGERVVIINTGNGLKDVDAAMQAVAADTGQTHHIRPEMAAVEAIFG